MSVPDGSPDDYSQRTLDAATAAVVAIYGNSSSWRRSRGLDADETRRLGVASDACVAQLARVLRTGPRPEDVEDVCQESFARFLHAVQAGRVSESGSPAGYLLVTARNYLINRSRRAAREVPTEDAVMFATPDDDDEVAALVDRVTSHDEVVAVLRRAAAARDYVFIAVVRTWLDLAGETGRRPSSRDVAEQCGYSKTTVANKLRVLVTYLADAGRPPGPPSP